MQSAGQIIRGVALFLFFNTLFQNTYADTLNSETLPPSSVLQHHSKNQLPQPYWPFSLGQLASTKGFQPSRITSESDHCRYPAHAYYAALEQGGKPPGFEDCTELKEFLYKAPVDSISLIYVSENLMSPSSMLGHVFLKLAGTDETGTVREHAVSFFTDLERFNYPKLLFDTLWRGKQGRFALSPYSKFIDSYVHTEKRNLWEYEVQMNAHQRRLVQLHLWELKQSDLPYFFDRYNCATLISHILRVGRPEITLKDLNKVSPLDVVKAVEQAKVVASKRVVLSTEWRTRMLSDTLSSERVQQIQSRTLDKAPADFESNHERFLYAELGLAHIAHQLKEANISKDDSISLTEHYQALKSGLEDFKVDLSSYKTPSKLANDTQWFMAYVERDAQPFLRLGFLPAGLRNEDDSRQYFGNNELRLMEGTILVGLEHQEIHLDEFALYALSSLKPYNALTGGLSGKFEIIVQDHFDAELNAQSALDIEGGVGLTKALGNDISLYVLPAVGLGLSRGDMYLHGAAEVGVLIDTVYNSKLRGSFSRAWGQINRENYFDTSKVVYSKYLSQNWTASVSWNHLKGERRSFDEYGLTIKYLY